MSVERPLADAADRRLASADRRLASTDPASHRWVEQLQPDHPRHDQAVAKLHDALAPRPSEQAERREQLLALKRAIEADLTARQRDVFVAIALNNDVPIDVLALEAARRFGDIDPE